MRTLPLPTFCLATALITSSLLGCAHRQQPTTDTIKVGVTVLTPNQGVNTAGGGGFVGFPDYAEQLAQTRQLSQIYLDQCAAAEATDCGVYIDLTYDKTIDKNTLYGFVGLVAGAFADAGVPIYARIIEDNSPRGVHLHARVTAGHVRLLTEEELRR